MNNKKVLEVLSFGLMAVGFVVNVLSSKVADKQADIKLKEEVSKAVAEHMTKTES